MANLVAIQKWDNLAVTQAAAYVNGPYIYTKDEDFGMPGIKKYIYAVYITLRWYTTLGTPVNEFWRSLLLNYAIDGSTTFVDTYVPTAIFYSANAFQDIDVVLSTPILVQSIRLKVGADNNNWGEFDVKDISIEWRPIHKRVST